MRKWITEITVATLALSLLLPPSANAAWNLESDNGTDGLTASASTFWIQRVGPVDFDELMTIDQEEGSYWATLTVLCTKKRLYVAMGINQFGSGHDDLKLDDPGFADLIFNNQFRKRFRTWGSGVPANIAFSTDANKLTREMLIRKTMSTVIRVKFSKERIPLLFDISKLSKAKTRFRYAGCKID